MRTVSGEELVVDKSFDLHIRLFGFLLVLVASRAWGFDDIFRRDLLDQGCQAPANQQPLRDVKELGEVGVGLLQDSQAQIGACLGIHGACVTVL